MLRLQHDGIRATNRRPLHTSAIAGGAEPDAHTFGWHGLHCGGYEREDSTVHSALSVSRASLTTISEVANSLE